LTTVNPEADAAKTAENPKAAAMVCTAQPELMSSTDLHLTRISGSPAGRSETIDF